MMSRYFNTFKVALGAAAVVHGHSIKDGKPKEGTNGSVGAFPHVSLKKTDYLKWEDYFMATAFLAGQRSKDPNTQVGACIVEKNNKIIVGVGYNGFPRGCHDDEFPWDKIDKHLYVVHAEMNAILNRNTTDLKGSTIYVSLFPCNRCAQMIIQSGIQEVVYMSDKNADKPEVIASKKMFKACQITFRKFKPKNEKIEIDFTKIKQYAGSSAE